MGLWEHWRSKDFNSKLVFEGVEPDAIRPSRNRPTDAGLDLYCQDDHQIPANGFKLVGSGVRVQLMDDEWGLLLGRSSTLAQFGLLVAPGVIDSEYTGEIKIAVQNLTDTTVHVAKGQRIAQFILMSNLTAEVEPVWDVVNREGSRGSSGFGSSGS